MPRGPKGEKRRADVIGNAVHVMRIATGEIEEAPPKSGRVRNGQAQKRERKPLSPETRGDIAKKAAAKRWKR
jgi:hypothetical protein